MPVPKAKSFNDKEYVTVSRAASELGFTAATIRRWCEKGHLEWFQHPANNWRWISRDSVDSLKNPQYKAS